jgi:hypothetical protein
VVVHVCHLQLPVCLLSLTATPTLISMANMCGAIKLQMAREGQLVSRHHVVHLEKVTQSRLRRA